MNVLRIDARSFIIVAVSETAVGVVSWVMQLILSSVAPTGSATRPLQVSPRVSWLDLTCETPADLEGAPENRTGRRNIQPRTSIWGSIGLSYATFLGCDGSGLERATLDLLGWLWPNSTKHADQVISGNVRSGDQRLCCTWIDRPTGRTRLVDRCLFLRRFHVKRTFPRSL